MSMLFNCSASNWNIDLFWNSEIPILTTCLRYQTLDLLPSLIFLIIFIIDFFANKSIINKNRLVDYFRTYKFRSLTQFILIGTCLFELALSSGIFFTPTINNPKLLQFVQIVLTLKLCIYVILLQLDISHYLKNIGVSALSSLVVSIDWFCKAYLLFEVSYLHLNLYSIYECISIIVQSTCLTLLVISYVFLPNPIVENLKIEKNDVKSKASKECVDQNESSIHKRSLFAHIMFFYFEPYVLFGVRNRFNMKNILPLENELKVNNILSEYANKYRQKYLKNSKMESYNILHLLLCLYVGLFAFNFFLFVIQITLTQLDPQIIKWLITFFRVGNEFKWHGYLYCLALLMSTLTRVTVVGVLGRNLNYIQVKLQVILVNHIYKKALKRSTLKDDQSFDTYNLMTVDVNNIIESLYFFFDTFHIPVTTIMSIYFIYREIGVAIFYSLLIFLVIGPLIYLITVKTKSAQQLTMQAKDGRLKFLSDLINGIRTVKLNYFDEIFKQKVTKIREEEVKYFKRYQIYFGISSVIFYSLTILLSLLSFTIYLLIDEKNVLTPERAFTTIGYFSFLKISFLSIPRTIHLMVVSIVAGKRIQDFLRSPEKDDYVKREFDENDAIQVENANFTWRSDSNEPILKNLNIKIKKNSHVALVSKSAASGRSSFLSCLLGEMRLLSNNEKETLPKVNISNEMQIAFVDGKPCIERTTIKENILFGMPFDQGRYDHVIEQCLIHDELMKYSDADDHVIDQDVNIEFRQKICLARAYYADANLILLDDFLNSFNESSSIVFEKFMNQTNGLFKDKTCIMVLNRMEHINHFDQILVFDNGEVRCEDISTQLTENTEIPENDRSIETMLKSSMTNHNVSDVKNLEHEMKKCAICAKQLIDDDKEVTDFSWPIYKLYFSTWNNTWLFLLIVSYFLTMVFQICVGIWLSSWSSNSAGKSEEELKDYNYYGLIKYAILSLLVSIFYTIGNFSAIYGEVSSAITFHRILLDKVLRLPLYFFDKTPTGSIINRFSKDIETVDHVVPFFFKLMIYLSFQLFSVFLVIVVSFPMAIIIILVMMIVFFYLLKIFLKTLIAVRTFELQTRTVLYNRFEALSSMGLQTMLAYDKSNFFIETMNQDLERNARCTFMILIAMRWLALRNEMIGIVILISTSLLFVINSETIDSGKAALALNFSIHLMGLLMGLMSLFAVFFSFVSIERIYKYLELEEEESDAHRSNSPENWPTNGKIKFENFSSTHSLCRNASLLNLNFEIDKPSLIAIVGKSGSGKSSLALSILKAVKRLNGKISIDDVDIATIKNESLRKCLAIFPQGSFLFTGSIRFNLDPEHRYTDSELWTVLEYVGMKEQIKALDQEIDGQKAFSLGQCQLLSLARTFLKPSKVMIIDETDCQFDCKTENRLRELFRTIFKDRTILLITKNVGHIQEADKVLILENGQIRDFDTPDKMFAIEHQT